GGLPRGGAGVRAGVGRAAPVRGIVRPAAFVQRYGPAPEALARAASRLELPDPQWFADHYHYPEVLLRRVGSAARESYRARTDADGAFALAGIPAGRYEALVWANVPYEGGYRTTRYGPLGPFDV